MELNRNQEQALRDSVLVVARWAKDGRIYIPRLDPEVQLLNHYFEPVFQAKGHVSYIKNEAQEFMGYFVSEENADKIVTAALTSHKAVPLIRARISSNIFKGYEMPKKLMLLVGGIIDGRLKLAATPSVKPNLMHRNALLVSLAMWAKEDYGIVKMGNALAFQDGESRPIVGCTIAAAALHAFGVSVSPKQAYKICAEKSNLSKALHGFRLRTEWRGDIDEIEFMERLGEHHYQKNESVDKELGIAMEYFNHPI